MGVGSYDGDDVNVKGDDGSDDGVKITVTTDGAKKRLDVDAKITGNVTLPAASWNKKLRYDDMNASTGGVARGTSLSGGTWTQVYSYSGTGFLAGALMNIETWGADWEFKLIVDGDAVFTLNAGDLSNDAIYDVDDVTDANQVPLGISKGSHDRFIFHAPINLPIQFDSSVVFQARKIGGAKKFQAGLVVLSKLT